MKKLLLNLLLMFTFISGVKSQAGSYCMNRGLTTTCYELKKDNRFVYKDLTCSGVTAGKGRYAIDDDKIKFIYEDQLTIRKEEEIRTWIIIKFSVKDFDTGKAITDYKVIKKKRNTLEKLEHVDNQIKTFYRGESIVFNISGPEYPKCSFKIKNGGQYTVDLFLRKGTNHIKRGTEEFDIETFTKDDLTLSHENYAYKLELKSDQ